MYRVWESQARTKTVDLPFHSTHFFLYLLKFDMQLFKLLQTITFFVHIQFNECIHAYEKDPVVTKFKKKKFDGTTILKIFQYED